MMKEKELLFALSLGFAGMILAVQAAQAAPACGQRDAVLTELAVRYGEARTSIGLAANNTVMEVFASPDTGTWSITATMPDGTTCLLASGLGYEAVSEEMPAKGDPA